VVTLKENEERLVAVLRTLPPELTDLVITWATGLKSLAQDRPVNWSDAWTDEDLADAKRASDLNLDRSEQA
jgi:hypothetical protein